MLRGQLVEHREVSDRRNNGKVRAEGEHIGQDDSLDLLPLTPARFDYGRPYELTPKG